MSRKEKQKENRRVIARRTFLLGSGMVLISSFLSGRLYQLQVAQNRRYQRLSDRNQFDMRIVPPRRGRLIDRERRLLAGNAESYRLNITPLYAGNLEKALARLPALSKYRTKAPTSGDGKDQPSFRPYWSREPDPA